MHNLTKTIAAVSLLAPASAYPLGIGDIKLHSALNQNLDAEIALILSADEDISDVHVRLAPPEKFDEAGVPWSYFLSKIKFETVVLADGSAIVKLSSKEAYREPFLDFLLEVSWANGNLYREFTVLIDPPVAYTQPVIPVIQKVEQKEHSEVEDVEEIIAVKEITEQSSDVTTEVIFNQAPTQYGPTMRRDSLWRISEDSNIYNDVSQEQMMMAIYQANPKAFYKDNVNALMAGHTLVIPEKEIILKMSRKQAIAAFKKQDDEWQGRVAVKPKEQEPVSDSTETDTKLELKAPVESEIPETVVVVSEKEASADSVVESEAEATELMSSEESLALQTKMEDLKQKLAMMQKMLIIKDKEIAALQIAQSQKKSTAVVPANDPKYEESTEKNAEPKTEQPAGKEVTPVIKAEPKVIEKPKFKPVVQPEPEAASMPDLVVGGFGTAILGVLGWLWWRKRKLVQEADTESLFAAASEISFPDSSVSELSVPVMEDETSSYDVGTVGESSFLSEFTPSDFDAFESDQNEVDPISEADVYLAYGRYQQAEDLMRQAIEDQPERDECKLKLLEIFYANENKSSFEEYATELVTAGKNSDQAFWEKIVEMGTELDPESSLYTEKATLETGESKEIAEDSVANSVDESTAADNQSKGESLDNAESENVAEFDFTVFDEDKVEPEDKSTATDNQSEGESLDNVKFDNEAESVFDEDKKVEPEDGAEEKTENASLDFDLSVFDLDESDSNKTESVDSTTNTEEMESVEFESPVAEEPIEAEKKGDVEEIESLNVDLGATSEAEPNDDTRDEIVLISDDEKDESLENFDFSADESVPTSVATESTSTSAKSETESIESFDFDFETDKAAAPSAIESLHDLDEGVSDLTDLDELETKLDLAKAYVDMGDSDAAKNIAEEVLKKGNEEQKKVAQEVMDQL